MAARHAARVALDCSAMAHPTCPAFRLNRRQALGLTLSAAGWLATPASARAPTPRAAPALRVLAHGSLPPGTEFKGTLVGGLSGLTWDAQDDLWYALSDDRSRHAPARCYVFRLPPLTTQPLLPQWVDVITLLGADGKPFARHAVDPEAIALRRDAATGAVTLLWTSEGDIRAQIPPSLHESALDGRLLRTFTLPDALREMARMGKGPRHNETLEGLALAPDGRYVWAAMEGALAQDRDGLTPGAPPGPCRLTRFDVATGRADRQVAYQPEPRPFGPLMPTGGIAESGISEIILSDDDHLWVLERAWTPATGVSARLYEADLRHASDTLGVDTLTGRRYRPCAKRLLLDLRQCGLPHVDNFEAMAWGPRLPNGHRTLVMCTDDNFNPLQVTQFAAFEVESK